MPRRNLIFANGEYYHIFNRSAFRQPILTKKRDTSIFHQIVQYYLQSEPPTKFSYFNRNRDKYKKLDYRQKIVTVIAYCYMPNHFHFILRQEAENGVQKYMQKIQNSYSHYYKLKYQTNGPLFESPFKAVHIESNDQLIHLSRYIHLNPVTSFLVEKPEEFQYSSYLQYFENLPLMIDPDIVINQFKSKHEYKKFVNDNKEYQRELNKIKHLIFK